jgi:murein DD-endopeptidase MepM/ murein hydrolase activator NlpD
MSIFSSRYLGSDELVAGLYSSSANVASTALTASASIKKNTEAFLDTVIQNNERLMKLSQQLLAAKAEAASRPSGLAAFAEQGLKFILKQEQQKQQEEAAKQKLQQKKNYEEALSRLGQLTQDYYESNGFNKELIDEKGTVVTGAQSFRDSAIRILSEVGELEPEDRIKIISKINEVAEQSASSRQRKLAEAIERQQAARADVIEAGLEQDLVLLFANIKKAGINQQAKPWLDQISNKLKEFLAANNTLTEDQKLNIAAKIIRQTTQAYGIKAENFAKYNADLFNFTQFTQEYNKALLEFRLPNHPDFNNYDIFKAKVGAAAIKYGDWSSNVAQINEAEKLQKETAELNLAQQKIQEEATKIAATQYKFSDSLSLWVAANAISNPFYASYLKSSPYADNPAIKNGLFLAEEYARYEKDSASLNSEIAGLDVSFARLNLRRASDMASLIKQLATRNSSGQLTPADMELLSLLQQNAPELYGIIASKLSQPNTEIDMKALNDALTLEQNAITQVQDALIKQAHAKRNELIAKYPHLEQAGLLRSKEEINQIAAQNRELYQKELDAALQFINEQKQKILIPPPYGVQPNFDGSSTYAPDVDERGRVRVAPRARLQQINVDGASIVSPVAAGASAPITSGFGTPRAGGRKHAGVDFSVEGNERSIALVSGIAYVGSAQGYGNFIDILGDNGYVYRYAHQGSLVKTGQRVKAGQHIGYSDNSGTNIGGHHLHFEVRKAYSIDKKGNYTPSFNWDGVVDPIDHLKQLSIGDSNVLIPRIPVAFSRTHPHIKSDTNAFITGKAAIQANTFQLVGHPPHPVAAVLTAQRPIRKGMMPFNKGNSISYDYGDDYGYAILRKKPTWRKALVDTAKALQVPAHWIADIIQQECGWKINLRHGGRISGIIGFDDPTAASKSFEQQMKMMFDYYKKVGWFEVLKKKGPQATIADFWILTRAGTVPLRSLGGKNMRQYIIDGGNPFKMRMNDLGTTFGYELGLLGKWVGRKYSIPGAGPTNSFERQSRNKAIEDNYLSNCPICEALRQSRSWAPHQHENLP